MAQQYQAYEKPTYGDHQSLPPAPPSYPQAPESHPQYYQQSTILTQQQNMSQPNMTYHPQQPMSEKQQNPLSREIPMAGARGLGSKWTFGMFDCCSPFSTCLLGTCCPCVLFGKTYARERGEGESSGLGGMCCVWYLAAQFGFNSCLQCVIRGQQRERHGIEGGTFGDFCGSLCCACCTLIQEEKESVLRQTGVDPKTGIAYQPINQTMQYPA